MNDRFIEKQKKQSAFQVTLIPASIRRHLIIQLLIAIDL